MPPLYPKMRERPQEFRVNLDSPLVGGLILACLGGHGCIGSAVFPDSSLYSHHGKLTNMDPAADWSWVPELGRWGLVFDGMNQEVPLSGTGNRLDGINVLSVAGWLAPATQKTQSSPAWINNGHTGPFDILGTSYGMNWAVYLNGATRTSIWGETGKWIHAAVTWDGEFVRAYRDGSYQNSGAYSTPLNSTSRLIYLADKSDGTYRGFIGKMSDQLFWRNRALTSTEIAALADPSNVDLRVGGVPLILPPRRRFFASVEIPAPTFNPAWAQHVNSYIGLGR